MIDTSGNCSPLFVTIRLARDMLTTGSTTRSGGLRWYVSVVPIEEERHDRGQRGRQRLRIGDETVQFTDRGHGEPLLLIHAGVFAAWFATVADDPALTGFRLIMPVRAGYDPTAPAPSRHLTLADHAQHCAAVLDSLGIGQTHVLAHS